MDEDGESCRLCLNVLSNTTMIACVKRDIIYNEIGSVNILKKKMTKKLNESSRKTTKQFPFALPTELEAISLAAMKRGLTIIERNINSVVRKVLYKSPDQSLLLLLIHCCFPSGEERKSDLSEA